MKGEVSGEGREMEVGEGIYSLSVPRHGIHRSFLKVARVFI